MADFIHHLLFGIYPYIALAVLAVGSVIRYDREPYSWRAGSSQLLRRKKLIVGSIADYLPWPKNWLYPIAKKKDLIAGEVYRPNPAADCHWCEFRSLCPLWPEGQPLFDVEVAR